VAAASDLVAVRLEGLELVHGVTTGLDERLRGLGHEVQGLLVVDLRLLARVHAHLPEGHGDGAGVDDRDLAVVRIDHPEQPLVVGMRRRIGHAARGDAGDAPARLVEPDERGNGRGLEVGTDLLLLELLLAPAELAPQVPDELAELVGVAENVLHEDRGTVVRLLGSVTVRLIQWSRLHRFFSMLFLRNPRKLSRANRQALPRTCCGAAPKRNFLLGPMPQNEGSQNIT
jgi:hypothetical protein